MGYPIRYIPAEDGGPVEIYDAYAHRIEALAAVYADEYVTLSCDGFAGPWGVPVDDAHFPDPAFRAVAARFDKNGSGTLSEREQHAATLMDCNGLGIADMTGLALFPSLQVLYCGGNALESLTLPALPELCFLDCCDNPLETLDVSGAPALRLLDVCGTALETLDLRACPALLSAAFSGETRTVDGCTARYIPAEGRPFAVVRDDEGNELRCDALLLCPEGTVLLNGPAAAPSVKLDADGRLAKADNFDGLYARVALVLDNNGVTGLYVTQTVINPDGSIVIPAFQVPGMRVTGISIALVPTLEDITNPTPNPLASDFIKF